MNRGLGIVLYGLLQIAVSVFLWRWGTRIIKGPPASRRPAPPWLNTERRAPLGDWRRWALLLAIGLGGGVVFMGIFVAFAK